MVNTFTGMGGHHGAKSKTDRWLTPPAIIEALGGWQRFDLDPCAEPGQAEILPTALAYHTANDNGLILPWWGRVWLNPPYTQALLRRFMARMSAHGRGTALIFARTETAVFHDHVYGAAAGIIYLRGRLCFHLPDGSVAVDDAGNPKNAGAPSVLIAYGEEDLDILAAAPIDGHFELLRLPAALVVTALNPTWAGALRDFFSKHDGPVALGDLYRAFADHPKSRGNTNYRAKLRQTLQQRGEFERVDRGIWQRRAAA